MTGCQVPWLLVITSGWERDEIRNRLSSRGWWVELGLVLTLKTDQKDRSFRYRPSSSANGHACWLDVWTWSLMHMMPSCLPRAFGMGCWAMSFCHQCTRLGLSRFRMSNRISASLFTSRDIQTRDGCLSLDTIDRMDEIKVTTFGVPSLNEALNETVDSQMRLGEWNNLLKRPRFTPSFFLLAITNDFGAFFFIKKRRCQGMDR